MARRNWTIHRDQGNGRREVTLDGEVVGYVSKLPDGRYIGETFSGGVTGTSKKMRLIGAKLAKMYQDGTSGPTGALFSLAKGAKGAKKAKKAKKAPRRKAAPKRERRATAAAVKEIEDPYKRAMGRWAVAYGRGGLEGAISATKRRINATSNRDKLQGIREMLDDASGPWVAGLQRQVDAKLRGGRGNQEVRSFHDSLNAYAATQTDEDLPTGTLFIVPPEKIVGISWAWPIAVTARSGELHTVDSDPRTWTGDSAEPEIAAAVTKAIELAQAHGWKLAPWALE